MPSWYTEVVERGGTFEQFAWRCARAIGFNARMREASADERIREYVAIEDDRILCEEAQERLVELNVIALGQAEILARQEFEADMRRFDESLRERVEKGVLYAALAERVSAWTVPTPDHECLKTFMLEQLSPGMDKDSGWYEQFRPRLRTGADWLKRQVAKAMDDVKYFGERYEKDVAFCRAANEWNRLLAESVPMPERIEP